MDSKPPPKLCELEKSLRDVAISRRGGVRTRGGRLPPIRMRDLSQVVTASASTPKKVVAPKIPQRRIKKESEQRTDYSAEPFHRRLDPSPGGGGRRGGDGRRARPARAVLQTGGTFLAEGPAARIKKDVSGLDLGFSMPRSSAIKEEAASAAKYDAGMIRDVMDSYEANQFYLDAIGEIPPYRLPLLKKEALPQIKSEIDEDGVKVEIKKEFAEDDDDDDTTKLKTEVKTSLEYFKDVEREGLLILLKLPTPSPFAKTTAKETDSKEEKADGKETQVEEGLVGKLRFMRSGRMRLVLGEVNLELEDDVPSESYTEAACVRVLEEGGADLIVLGKVDRSMVLNPILGSLVDEESPDPSCSGR